MHVLLPFLAALALADDPTTEVDGTVVRGSAHIEVAPQRFLAQLEDPAWESSVSGSHAQVELKARSGDCQHVAFVFPNPIMDATYEVQRCPSAQGWQSTLITSPTFSAYRSEWKVAPEGEGSRITYEVDMTNATWVPNTVVRSETRRSVLKLMEGMVAWAKGQPRP